MVRNTSAGTRKARRKEERRGKRKRRWKEENENKVRAAATSASPPRAKKVANRPPRSSDQKRKESEDTYANLNPEVAAALRNDDAEIAELEAKLGMAGDKKMKSRLHKEYAKLEGYGEDFGNFLDGLDSLMERVSSEKLSRNEDVSLSDGEHSDEDSSLTEDVDDDDIDSGPFGQNDYNSNSASEDEEEKTNSDSASGNEEETTDDSVQDEPDHDVQDTYRPKTGEDIYGVKIEEKKSADKPKKYVPPHLRNKEQDEGDLQRLRDLRRALNNSLNRLSEDTLISVAQSIAGLYPSNPTSDVNSEMWKITKSTCVDRPIVMSAMIPVFVACLAGVHFQTGDSVQLGGYVLEQVITELWHEMKSFRAISEKTIDGDQAPEKKDASNLVLILCSLYNYGIVQCTVIYGVVRNLIDHFTEVDVELLLLILSQCGFALRSDDPAALKEIILLVQGRALTQSKNDQVSSSRVEYMVSAMTDLKNNKKRKQDQAIIDGTSRLRKQLGHIKSNVATNGRVRASDSCLRITLEDILNVEEKGRWWKVGASWAGNQFRHNSGDSNDDEETDTAPSTPAQTPGGPEDKLLKLASKYRMNTEIRRSIFCVIMGSVDCDDAFEKLVRGGMLKNKTERETVRVLMECCGNEKSFNPFYAHLASRICDYQSQCKFTFQLSFWDVFKQFELAKARKAANLAKLLYHLVAKQHNLRLSILKVLDMSTDTIEDNAVIFLTVFFSSIFESFDDPAEVFQLISRGVSSGRSDRGSQENAEGNEGDAGDDGLREALSVFFLQTLKSSPKNKKKSKFRANFKAALKACESLGSDPIF